MASTTVRSDGLRPPPDGNDRNADENGVGQTKKRFGNVATSSNGSGDDPPRITHGAPFGSGFGNGGNGWQNGGIWANTIGSGMRTGSIDIGRMAGNHGGTAAAAEHADRATRRHHGGDGACGHDHRLGVAAVILRIGPLGRSPDHPVAIDQ
jgi:hypothetical protein